MLCMSCGGRMRLVRVVPDTGTYMRGYEHHTLECPDCGEVEERLTFRHPDTPPPPIFPTRTVLPAPPPAPARAPETIIPDPTPAPARPAPPPAPNVMRAMELKPEQKPAWPLRRKAQPPPRPQKTGAWERAVETLRAHQDDLARRAPPLPKPDAQARERFAAFWDALIPQPPKKPVKPALPPPASAPPAPNDKRASTPSKPTAATSKPAAVAAKPAAPLAPLPRSLSLVVIAGKCARGK